MFKSRLAALTITTALTSLTVFAQEDYTRLKSEASVQVLGSFVKRTTENGVDRALRIARAFSEHIATTSVVTRALRRIIHGHRVRKPMADSAWIRIRMKSRRPMFSGCPESDGRPSSWLARVPSSLIRRTLQGPARKPELRSFTAEGLISISLTISSSEVNTAGSYTARQRTI